MRMTLKEQSSHFAACFVRVAPTCGSVLLTLISRHESLVLKIERAFSVDASTGKQIDKTGRAHPHQRPRKAPRERVDADDPLAGER